MNKIIKSALSALSKHDIDLKNNYEQTRQFQRATRPYTKKISCNMMERVIRLDGRDILTRAFSYCKKFLSGITYSGELSLSQEKGVSRTSTIVGSEHPLFSCGDSSPNNCPTRYRKTFAEDLHVSVSFSLLLIHHR